MSRSAKTATKLFAIWALVFGSAIGCQSMRRTSKAEPTSPGSTVDGAFAQLSIQQLDQLALVFRVAFDKSLESWQASGNDGVVPGCKITGPEAEAGLAEVRPWLDRRASEEARQMLEGSKSYQIPGDSENCESSCSCGLALRILEAGDLDQKPHSRVKDLKKKRARLEAKAELITAERAELCVESLTWVCSSEVLKALKSAK